MTEYEEMEKKVEAYNKWDGQAIITLSNGEIHCTVGQSECYVPGYKVLALKLAKDDPFITVDYILERIEELNA